MFETGTQTAEYGGRRRRRRCRCDDEAEAGYGPGEYEASYGEAGYGPGEYEASYGETGYGPGEYEASYGETGYGPGEYEASYGETGYGPGEYEASYGETGYGPGEYEASYGETGYGPGEYEASYGETGYGPGEYEASYGETGYGPGEYEASYGETGYGPGEYEASYGETGYGPGEYESSYGETGYGPGEYEASYGEAEEQFLPLIPVVGKVLGGLLGGLMKESESMYPGGFGESESMQSEAGEAEEQFLHKIFLKVLGREAEQSESVLSPAQEAQFAAQLLEVSDEEEMDEFLGGIVNTIGRAVQGVSGAANSPQGRALIEAVKPLARAALPLVGGAIGSAIAPGIGTQIGSRLGSAASSLFEMEMDEMNEEEQQFEVARRVVRLTSAAAQDVATAPPGAPPQLVGELAVIRAGRQLRPTACSAAPSAPSRRSRAATTDDATAATGALAATGRYGGYRRLRRVAGSYGRYWGGYRAATATDPATGRARSRRDPHQSRTRHRNRHLGHRRPAQPGFRWVAVPIGAPPPAAEPPAAGRRRPAAGAVSGAGAGSAERVRPLRPPRPPSTATAADATAPAAGRSQRPLDPTRRQDHPAGRVSRCVPIRPRHGSWSRRPARCSPGSRRSNRSCSRRPASRRRRFPGGAFGHRATPHRRPARGARRGPGVHPLDSGCRSARVGSRAAAPVLVAALEVPERPIAVRPVLRSDHPAQRGRQRRAALGARRRGGRGAPPPGQAVRGTAGRLLAAPRARRGDPPRPDEAARWWRQSCRSHPDPSRAHDRVRHRLLASARGRPSGRGAARAGGLATRRAAPRFGRRAGYGGPGLCGTAGSPRSWPTTGRSARSGSGRRSG